MAHPKRVYTDLGMRHFLCFRIPFEGNGYSAGEKPDTSGKFLVFFYGHNPDQRPAQSHWKDTNEDKEDKVAAPRL